MGRVINTDSTGKQRNNLMRTCAELVRRISQKPTLDDESKDMLALMVYCLREIEAGIDTSAAAWEKRDYWTKADELRTRWSWTGAAADELQALIFDERWDDLPTLLVKLFPRFSDIKITKLTRKETLWQGSYLRLLGEKPPTLR